MSTPEYHRAYYQSHKEHRKMHPTTCAAIEQAAIQAERERCAKIAESYSQFAYYPKAIAKAIRGGEHDPNE